jgi:hypothetical protein
MNTELWPALPLEEWQDTYATLHMWTQIVGKIRLAQTPLVNHWWNAPLYLTARGLTTSPFPYGDRHVQIDFDFVDHRLVVEHDDGTLDALPLAPRPVADFYAEVMAMLHRRGIDVEIWPMPVEIDDPIRFDLDTLHASYDPEYAHRCWRVLQRTERVFLEFRSRFLGKCSPVHFFWGSFDHAVTRFSGRRAPEREGADPITREAYSHEVISHGFWPGVRRKAPSDRTAPDGLVHEAAFYSYTAPEPEGLSEQPIGPEGAYYHAGMKEFILPYEALRAAASPDDALLEFLQTTYEAGARLAGWDRAALERPPAAPAG